jgi:hypothetical protein
MIAPILLRKFGICFSLITALALVGFAGSASARAAATLTVCPSGCAFNQVAAAVAAANNGDTIVIAPGIYDGGFTIDVSIKLTGAGPGHTIISGGGPVITIGAFGAAHEPSVSIHGVTITGGVTRSSPESVPCTGKAGVWAAGGGIQVPPSTFSFGGDGVCDADHFGGGATVTITNSVITGNLVAPTDSVPFAPCGGCPAAWAFGGGIDTAGSLSLANTTVSNNLVGGASGLSGLARFAEGGGIFGARGDMTISNSAVSGNQAAASPHGPIADAGGIATTSTFTMSNSSVTDNSATVSDDFFFGNANAGGLHIKGDPQKGDAQTVSISNTTISGNAATVTSSSGAAFANQAGLAIDICPPAPCALSNDTISDNRVTATATGFAFGARGAGEFGGTLSNVRITGNSVDASSSAGDATALGGAFAFDGGTIRNSLINDNHVHAAAPLGTVDVSGGGLDVFGGPTTLRNSTVSGNTVDGSGTSGSARGGGIADIAFPFGPNGPPGGPLVLRNSNVTANTLSGAGLTLQGGGIFAQDEPVTLTNSLISGNVPDQCFGC